MQKILGCIRRAVTDYKMISEGDKIAVGISGGKDSLLLYAALDRYSRFSPVKFELVPIHINMNFEATSQEEMNALKSYFIKDGRELVIEDTRLAELLFEVRKESSPCSLCSKIRRGALNSKATELGCNKIALGHHADDVLETMLLSFLYEARFATFKPVSYMDRSGITLIRPMIYVDESDIKGAVKRLELPVVFNPCPMDKHSKREYMKDLVRKLNSDIPFAKERMMSAIMHPERNSLWENRDE